MNARDAQLGLDPPSTAMSLLRAWAPVLGCLVLALVMQVLVGPFMVKMGWDFAAKLLVDIGTNIILAVSLTMVNGFTGQFSIGHAAFMAVGAYVAACITYYGSFHLFGTPDMAGGQLSSMLYDRQVPWLTRGDGLFLGSILAGGGLAAACGYLVGLPSLRLRGDYLAIVTLGFGEIVRVLIQTQTEEALYDPEVILGTPAAGPGMPGTPGVPWWKLPKYLGGALGFSGLPLYTSLFWVWTFALLTLLVAYRIKNSTYGRAFLSIREDEIASEAMGVDTTKYKVRAFVISAFFAGCAGALFAHTVGVQLNAGELGFVKSFDIIIMVVLGGLGSISGAMFAAIILTLLPELLRNVQEYRMVAYASALIVMMLVRPQGLLGVREIWEKRTWGRLLGDGRKRGKP